MTVAGGEAAVSIGWAWREIFFPASIHSLFASTVAKGVGILAERERLLFGYQENRCATR